MTNTVLKAQKRENKAKTKIIRKSGFIPGIIYGPKIKSKSLIFNIKEANKIIDKSHQASILSLEIEGEKEKRNVLIKELQFDKIDNHLLHIDLYEVNMEKEIETEVPLIFTGISEAVKNLGGILVKNEEMLKIKCLPKDLPEKIEVDLTKLQNLDDVIYIKDLLIPQGIEIQNNVDDVIIMVQAPRTEEELKQLDEKVEIDVKKVEGVEDKKEETEPEKGENKEGKPASKEEVKK